MIDMAFKVKWHEDLQIFFNDQTWQHFFNIWFKTVSDPYLKWFQYRILHRILGTQKHLHRMEISQSSKCLLCMSNEETLIHLFYFCHKSRNLWHQLENLIYRKTGFSTTFNSDDVLLGYRYNNQNSIALNMIIIVTKNYIFSSSRNALEINIKNLISKIQNIFEEQMAVARLDSNIVKFENSWCQLKKIFTWTKVFHAMVSAKLSKEYCKIVLRLNGSLIFFYVCFLLLHQKYKKRYVTMWQWLVTMFLLVGSPLLQRWVLNLQCVMAVCLFLLHY